MTNDAIKNDGLDKKLAWEKPSLTNIVDMQDTNGAVLLRAGVENVVYRSS